MKEELVALGLSEQEAEVYLESFKHPSKPVSFLAKKTHINRTVLYSVVESLIDKGLMAYILKITSEYFSSGLGWPLALILAGLAMIGVGYMSISIKKKYLSS